MTDLQKALYVHFTTAILDSRGGGGKMGTSTLGCINTLRSLCGHPKSVYDKIFSYADERSATPGLSDAECGHMFPASFKEKRQVPAAGTVDAHISDRAAHPCTPACLHTVERSPRSCRLHRRRRRFAVVASPA